MKKNHLRDKIFKDNLNLIDNKVNINFMKKDTISTYQTERHLYDARAAQVKTRKHEETKEVKGTPLEQELLKRLFSSQGIILRGLGRGIRYFVIALFYPFYLIYLVAKWLWGWVKEIEKVCRRGIGYVDKKLHHFLSSVQAGYRRFIHQLCNLSFILWLKRVYQKIKDFRIAIERWATSCVNGLYKVRNAGQSLWSTVVSPIESAKNLYKRLNDGLKRFFLHYYQSLVSFVDGIVSRVKLAGSAVKRFVGTIKDRLDRFVLAVYNFPKVVKERVLSLLRGVKERVQQTWCSVKERFQAFGQMLLRPFSATARFIRRLRSHFQDMLERLRRGAEGMNNTLKRPVGKMLGMTKRGKEQIAQMSQTAAITAKERVGMPMQRMANAITPSAEAVDALVEKGKFGVGSLKQYVWRVKDLVKGGLVKVGNIFLQPFGALKPFWMRGQQRVQTVRAWVKVFSRYLKHCLDEVYLELCKWVEPPK